MERKEKIKESPALKVICWISSSRDPNGGRLKNTLNTHMKICMSCNCGQAGTPLELQPAADHGRSRPVSGMP